MEVVVSPKKSHGGPAGKDTASIPHTMGKTQWWPAGWWGEFPGSRVGYRPD